MELAEQVAALAGARAEFGVQVSVGRLALTRFANSFIHQNVAEEVETVALRVAVDGRVAMAATTRTDGTSLRAFVDATLETARLRPVDEEWPGVTPAAPIPAVDHFDAATAAAGPQERAERVAAFVSAGEGTAAAGYCETSGGEVAFLDSAGQRCRGRSSRAIVDGIHQLGPGAGSGHTAAARLADLDAAGAGHVAARRAGEARDPFDLEPGAYEVVLGPECVATIATFLCFYGFNAKMYLEDRSFAEPGTTQFDGRFSLWDDVTDPRALGVGFDAEGTPRRKVEFVRAGVTVGLAHDRRTARRAGTASTGHHVPGAESHGPIPTSVFVGEGDTAPEDLIGGVERGLYVATFNYCRVLDPKSLSVTGLTRNGTFLVEDGRIAGAVTNLRFTQSFLEALAPGAVLAVGDDARLADSEFGPGMVHTPSLRLASWHFTGGAEG